MLSSARRGKNRNIKQGPKLLNFGASKPGVKGALLPRFAPGQTQNFSWKKVPVPMPEERHQSYTLFYEKVYMKSIEILDPPSDWDP